MSADNSPSAANKPAAGRVLVVDDEPLVRWAVAETLGDRGYQVCEAGNGESAIRALASEERPDVVLLDLRLPDFSDLALLAVVRRMAPSTPIILMTAYGTPELVERAHDLGAFTVISKPFELDELRALIGRALATSRSS